MAGLADTADNIITLGSLSKTFGMTGWRIGYMAASAELCRQALKVQDAMAICAPIISQVAATAALEQMPEYPLSMIAELDERRRVLEEALDKIPALHWSKTDGALFAMVRANVAGGDRELAWEALDRAQVLMVPGSAFGRQWEGFLRISYGCSPRDRYEEALSRLVEYFERTLRRSDQCHRRRKAHILLSMGMSWLFTGSMPRLNISSVTAPSRGVVPSSQKTTGDMYSSPPSLIQVCPNPL